MEKPVKKTKRKNKPGAGRPTKFCQEIEDKIIKAILIGSYVETAANHAGINKDTFYAWLKTGAKDLQAGKTTQLAKFSDAVQKAMADSTLRDIAFIDKAAAAGHWQASAWRLERKNPKQWGRRQIIEHEGNPEKPIYTKEVDIEDRLNILKAKKK